MILGRGGVRRFLILVGAAVIALAAVLAIGRFRSTSEEPRETTETAPQVADEPVQRDSESEPRAGDSSDDAAPAEDPRGDVADAPVIVGSRLRGGPRQARMERWQPIFGYGERSRTIPARSTIVEDPIRLVPLDDPEGLDLVALRVGRRRWDELASGVTGAVPGILWESAERVLSDAGELEGIHAGAVSPQAEYVLRFENNRLLLRLYGTDDSVDDMELEELSLTN